MSRDIVDGYKRARRTAQRLGHRQIADDFAGWVVVRWLEGKSQHQPLHASLIDFLRAEYGTNTKHCGTDAMVRLARREPSEQVINASLESLLAQRSGQRLTDILHTSPAEYLPAHQLEVWVRMTVHQQTVGEVGRELKVSKSRASQLVRQLAETVRTAEMQAAAQLQASR